MMSYGQVLAASHPRAERSGKGGTFIQLFRLGKGESVLGYLGLVLV